LRDKPEEGDADADEMEGDWENVENRPEKREGEEENEAPAAEEMEDERVGTGNGGYGGRSDEFIICRSLRLERSVGQ